MRTLAFVGCAMCAFLVLVSGNLRGQITVTNVNDSGLGSLRNAIILANTMPGPDFIDFNIPAPPYTIFPLSQLPQLTDPAGVMISGLTQPGAMPGSNPPSTATLVVEVNGTLAGPAHGFWIVTPDNAIDGLVINNFEQDGIRIEGTVGGTDRNIVFCNFIGTDPTGQIAQGNGWAQTGLWAGVDIITVAGTFASNNIVDANIASTNYAEGISIMGPGADSNLVILNHVGTDITGTFALGNLHDGVFIGEGAHDNVVDGNLICANGFEGVCIVGYAQDGISTDRNQVINNKIGLDVNLAPLPNMGDGVSIGIYGANIFPPWYQGGYAFANLVAGDTIAYNLRNGVMVWEHFYNAWNVDGNTITQNSIYDNGLLGIDLGDDGMTGNDPADPDTGANQELNFPVIDSAYYSTSTMPGTTTVWGRVDIDTDPTQATVEVFMARPDPSGYGEGQTYLGSTTPSASSNWGIMVAGVAPGSLLTSTATDVNFNTSEFCTNQVVVLFPGVQEESFLGRPSGYELKENYPNPFTHTTVIPYLVAGYRLPAAGNMQLETGNVQQVSLKVYDVAGRLVKNLVGAKQRPGCYSVSWDGRDESGRKVSPGLYFCRLQIEDFRAAKRLVLVR